MGDSTVPKHHSYGGAGEAGQHVGLGPGEESSLGGSVVRGGARYPPGPGFSRSWCVMVPPSSALEKKKRVERGAFSRYPPRLCEPVAAGKVRLDARGEPSTPSAVGRRRRGVPRRRWRGQPLRAPSRRDPGGAPGDTGLAPFSRQRRPRGGGRRRGGAGARAAGAGRGLAGSAGRSEGALRAPRNCGSGGPR